MWEFFRVLVPSVSKEQMKGREPNKKGALGQSVALSHKLTGRRFELDCVFGCSCIYPVLAGIDLWG